MDDNYLIREVSCIFEQLNAARMMLNRLETSLECLDAYVTELSEKSEKSEHDWSNKEYLNGFDAGLAYGKSLVNGKVKHSVERPCTCTACNSPEWYVMD